MSFLKFLKQILTGKTNEIPYNNPYKLSKTEYDKMVSLGSNTVILTNTTGIGITVKCLVNDEWTDITDYDKW